MSNDPQDKTPDAAYHDAPRHPDESALPPADFMTLVLSLATGATISMGEGKGPNGESQKDLGLARHQIDLLGVLQERTKGNLSGEEERLLNQVLFDLRMKFIEASAPAK
jgi:hypothetical protein